MNWMEWMSKIFTVAPAVVAGIEAIHGEKDTATKTQMAMDALGMSSQIATAVLPEYQQHIGIASQITASLITGLQQLHAAQTTQQLPLQAAAAKG